MVLEAILMGMGTSVGNIGVRNQNVLFVWESDEKEFPPTLGNLPKNSTCSTLKSDK